MTQKSLLKAPKADLQTAQNRMFPFVCEACDCLEKENRVGELSNDPAKIKKLYRQVQNQIFDLLSIAEDKRDNWHMGIADSGKRTIELLVNCLCSASPGKNALVDTENYVAFNKFSAATALTKQKQVAFEKPFDIELGRALTINSKTTLDHMTQLFEDDRLNTLWVAWNSTSTGVQEKITEIVKRRNQAQSNTLIIADAASLRLFSNDWKHRSVDELPDAFFFSLRKQGLPYDGPNDESHQARNSGSLIVFNDKTLQWAQELNAPTIYDSPTLAEYTQGRITQGEQRGNHIKHLLKLNCVLDFFLSRDRTSITALDAQRKDAQSKIMGAFAGGEKGSPVHFSLFSDPDAQSDSAYILKVPQHTSAKKVISELKQNGILISACLHPKTESQKYVRFAFYPGNSPDEVEYLLENIKQFT